MLAERLPAMWGSATLAIEVSSTSMNVAVMQATAISQGLNRGVHWTGAPRRVPRAPSS